MIQVVEANLSVSDRRRLRGVTTMEHPVLSVAPDSRRVCDLRRQVLGAMGISVDELRGRVDETEHVSWFRAWCSKPEVSSLTLLAPYTADPSALGLLLLDVEQRLGGVTVVAPADLPNLHRLLLERLADNWTSDTDHLPRTATRVVTESPGSGATPSVPRVHTLSLLRVSQKVHGSDDHAMIARRFHRHTTAFDTALKSGAPAVLRELQRAAGSVSSEDDLLLMLHGLAAAGWRHGGAIELDPRAVARRCGAALRDLAPATLERLSRQAFSSSWGGTRPRGPRLVTG